MKQVVIIGGGIAGMEAAAWLDHNGVQVTLLEQADKQGGKLLTWDKLFPTRRPTQEVLAFLQKSMSGQTNVVTNAQLAQIQRTKNGFLLSVQGREAIEADAVLIATGFDVFNARKKEEYGYGIYENVITSADLERLIAGGKPLVNPAGQVPQRIGFIHCVGSRDEKVGNEYCSRVCCVTAVKQSITVKERLPDAQVFCFYMDLRMFGRGYEKLYREAQEKHGVTFIRGRLSEACDDPQGRIIVKVEDTLRGLPLRMTVDLLVLMVGMVPSEGTTRVARMLDLARGSDGFIVPADEHTQNNKAQIPGVFLAGTCTGPKSIQGTIADARAACLQVLEYLKELRKGL
ncbi:MAG TPA: FAD-dependent oxidoreductase [Thermodesulfobacteriota bacterium]|nr:CoB--CoM heterodisulfide reductase iron-sulfur subunit A family protein [Deltaproteobacteria bacterium]HNU71081.1 FAD-dependent oxidoreductase [Thermodesulfobacteriota bacterium]HOC38224.1 FAD-dependent oxidoreductase [Thermodesulfobacteriota bacterium]